MRKKLASLILAISLLGGIFGYIACTNAPASASRSCANYTLNGPVTDVASAHHYEYILTTNGAVYGQCAPYFGGPNGQSYFNGRTADYINLCYDSNRVVGYWVVATSNERYNYGRVTGCTEIGF